MAIHHQSVDQCVVTLYNLGNAQEGYPCGISASGHAVSAASGADFVGVVHNVQSHLTGVVVRGCVELPYSGTEPVPGWCNLAADGNGGVTPNASCHAHLVLAINRTKKTVTIYL